MGENLKGMEESTHSEAGWTRHQFPGFAPANPGMRGEGYGHSCHGTVPPKRLPLAGQGEGLKGTLAFTSSEMRSLPDRCP